MDTCRVMGRRVEKEEMDLSVRESVYIRRGAFIWDSGWLIVLVS